jgi:hypothetical protein
LIPSLFIAPIALKKFLEGITLEFFKNCKSIISEPSGVGCSYSVIGTFTEKPILPLEP